MTGFARVRKTAPDGEIAVGIKEREPSRPGYGISTWPRNWIPLKAPFATR